MPHLSPGIAIVGPTATGKTHLALALAEWWLTETAPQTVPAQEITGVDIISADSRQIYSGLEIISGADVPVDFQAIQVSPAAWLDFAQLDSSIQTALRQAWQKTALSGKTLTLWGVATLPVTQSWSAAQFQVFGQKIIARAQVQHHAVIIVGGTGLYQQILWQKDWQISVPPDVELRTTTANATAAELQLQLHQRSPERLAALNPSDRANPRRLIRQLELAAHSAVAAVPEAVALTPTICTIGLTRPLTDLPALITARVEKRLQLGAQAEATALDPETTQPTVLTTLGVKELRLLATDQLSQLEAQALWAKRELQYAKRQITWWKKRPEIHWFEATQSTLLSAVTQLMTQLNPTLPLL